MQGVSAGILAGGRSRRMGHNKAALEYAGQSFVAHIAGQLTACDEVLLSAPFGSESYSLPLVPDIHPGHGPIGGLHALLTTCRNDWLLVVGCDMPLFTADIAAWLCGHIAPGLAAVVPVTPDGYLQPLCALWHKSCLPKLAQQIETGQNRVTAALAELHTLKIATASSGVPATALTNVNTPEAYAQLLRMPN